MIRAYKSHGDGNSMIGMEEAGCGRGAMHKLPAKCSVQGSAMEDPWSFHWWTISWLPGVRPLTSQWPWLWGAVMHNIPRKPTLTGHTRLGGVTKSNALPRIADILVVVDMVPRQRIGSARCSGAAFLPKGHVYRERCNWNTCHGAASRSTLSDHMCLSTCKERSEARMKIEDWHVRCWLEGIRSVLPASWNG